jgi:hypothetical protein
VVVVVLVLVVARCRTWLWVRVRGCCSRERDGLLVRPTCLGCREPNDIALRPRRFVACWSCTVRANHKIWRLFNLSVHCLLPLYCPLATSPACRAAQSQKSCGFLIPTQCNTLLCLLRCDYEQVRWPQDCHSTAAQDNQSQVCYIALLCALQGEAP